MSWHNRVNDVMALGSYSLPKELFGFHGVNEKNLAPKIVPVEGFCAVPVQSSFLWSLGIDRPPQCKICNGNQQYRKRINFPHIFI